MKVISLSQPWLWSIDTYIPPPGSDVEAKRIENRSWSPPEADIGTRIALHAAKSWDPSGISMFVRFGIDHPQRRDLYISSAISSVATIAFVGTKPEHFAPEQVRWFFGEYGWGLVDVRRLPVPIPWRGAQGMRHLPAATVAQIEEQLRG